MAAEILLPLADASLVLYCLVRSGQEWQAIDLSRPDRTVYDLGPVLPVFLGANLVAEAGVSALVGVSGPLGRPAGVPYSYLTMATSIQHTYKSHATRRRHAHPSQVHTGPGSGFISGNPS